MRPRIRRSTGNVFRDAGFSAEESEHLRIRTELMIALETLLAKRKLTQSQAAKVLRVTQPRVSDLVRGRIDLFSTDMLIGFLARLGVEVRVTLKPRKPKRVA